MTEKAIRNPPNLGVCRGCKHEWTARTFAACPKCESEKISVRCGARRINVKCAECNAMGIRKIWEDADGACPDCGVVIPTDLLCHKIVAKARGGRCKGHGKSSPRGPASATWKGGLTSKTIPVRYVKAFSASLADPGQLSMARDIAALDARRDELWRRFSTGESGEAWKTVREAYRSLADATEAGNPEMQRAAVEAMGKALDDGASDEVLWGQLTELVETRGQTVKVEAARMVAEKDFVPKEVMLGIVYGIVNATRALIETVADKTIEALEVDQLEPATRKKLLDSSYTSFAQDLDVLTQATKTSMPGDVPGEVQ